MNQQQGSYNSKNSFQKNSDSRDFQYTDIESGFLPI